MSNNKILGVRFDDFSSKGAFLCRILEEFKNAKASNQSKLIAHLNVHCLNLAYADEKFKHFLNTADVLFLDAIGLKLALNFFLKLKVSFASTPPEWMHDFFKLLPDGTRLFFIGDKPDVIKKYNNIFLQSFPQLKSVGYHHGFFLNEPLVEGQLLKEIKKNSPDIVIVGMGMPVQEFWIERIKNQVNVPMFIPVGAYYQRMLGLQKRPPNIISNIGMEWLYRFITDPKRLFKRYIVGNPIFILRIIRYRLNSKGEKFN